MANRLVVLVCCLVVSLLFVATAFSPARLRNQEFPGDEPTRRELQSSGTFTCPAFSASNTNSATQNYATCSFSVCGGSTLTISACGCNSDTFFILINSAGTEVSRNDDGNCGTCSVISYTVPGDANSCTPYSLRQGCYQSRTCSGQTTVTGATVTTPPLLTTYLAFDGNSNNQGYSGGATIVGSLRYASSNFGQAAYFNNANPGTTFPPPNYVLVPNSAGYAPMSVSFWFKVDSAASYQTVVALCASSQPNYNVAEFLQIDLNSGSGMQIALALPNSQQWSIFITTTTPYVAGMWQKVVVTVSASFVVTVYQNGVQTGTATGAAAPDASRYFQWLIGGSSDGYRSYQGWIDEFQVFNYVISGGGNVPLPVSYYPYSSLPNGVALSNNLIGLVALPTAYTISFDLFPTAVITRDWANVLHLTATGGSEGTGGGRLPSLQMCDSFTCPVQALYLEYSSFPSSSISSSQILPLNRWTTVASMVNTVTLVMTLSVTLGTTTTTQSTNFGSVSQTAWPSVQVYAANSNFHPFAPATIRNLVITSASNTAQGSPASQQCYAYEGCNCQMVCPAGNAIAITSANYGTFSGTWPNLRGPQSSCASTSPIANIVANSCGGKTGECDVLVGNDQLGGNPCIRVLKNLVVNYACAAPAPLPVSYYPYTTNPSGSALRVGNFLGAVALPSAYTVSFSMYLTVIPTLCTNIIHLTADGTNVASVGSRIPGVWFCGIGGTTYLASWYWFGSSTDDVLQGCPGSTVPVNKWVTVTVNVDLIAQRIALGANTDAGSIFPTVSKAIPVVSQTSWPNVLVYAMDPWHFPITSAFIINFAIAAPARSTAPSLAPIAVRTATPSFFPSFAPSCAPSPVPTALPTAQPSASRTPSPSCMPTPTPTIAQTRSPTASLTPSPTTARTPDPSASPTPVPTRIAGSPTPVPTTGRPSAVPTPRPTNPTGQPSSQPSLQPVSRPSGLPTEQPSSHPSTQPSSRPSVACHVGHYIAASLACLPCQAGSYSAHGNAGSCIPCAAGRFASSAGMSACLLCPVQFYSSSLGSTVCNKCSGGKITPLPGANSESQCLLPTNNFVLGSIALGLSGLGAAFYVIFGGFHKTAFIRRERVVMTQVKTLRSFFSRIAKSEEEMAEVLWSDRILRKAEDALKLHRQKKATRDENEQHQQQRSSCLSPWIILKEISKTLVFIVLATTVIVVTTSLIFALFLARIFFQTLIIYKQSSTYLPLPVDYKALVLSITAQIMDDLRALPPPIPGLFRMLFSCLVSLFDFLSMFRIDLSAVGVTCIGSSAPFQVLINLFVLGVVVIVVESELQVFRSLCFARAIERYGARLSSREYRLYQLRPRPGQEKRGKDWWEVILWYSWYATRLLGLGAVQVLFTLINFVSFLQLAMSLVQFKSFAEDRGFHAFSPTCNQVPRAENFDAYLAVGSSLVAYSLVLPVFYEVSKIVYPKEAQVVSKPVTDPNDDLHAHSIEDSSSKDTQVVSISEIIYNLPPSAWARLPFTLISPDLLLAHLTKGLVTLLDSSLDDKSDSANVKTSKKDTNAVVVGTSDVVEQGQMSLSLGEKYEIESKFENTKVGRAMRALSSSLSSFVIEVVETLRPMSSTETTLWEKEEAEALMPSYFELCQLELYYLTYNPAFFMPPTMRRKQSPPPPYNPLGYVLTTLLVIFPVGHVLTKFGRWVSTQVVSKYLSFVQVSLGYWSEQFYEAFFIARKAKDIGVSGDGDGEGESADDASNSQELHREEKNRFETNRIFADCLSATIATRAILLQIVPPFAIWSVFTIATAGCPLFVPSSGSLHRKMSQPFIWSCFKEAEGMQGDNPRGWVTVLSGIAIFLLESRVLNFIVSSYMVALSIYILYQPVTKVLVASVVLVLVPIAFAVALRLVVMLGLALNIKDIWNLSGATSEIKMEINLIIKKWDETKEGCEITKEGIRDKMAELKADARKKRASQRRLEEQRESHRIPLSRAFTSRLSSMLHGGASTTEKDVEMQKSTFTENPLSERDSDDGNDKGRSAPPRRRSVFDPISQSIPHRIGRESVTDLLDQPHNTNALAVPALQHQHRAVYPHLHQPSSTSSSSSLPAPQGPVSPDDGGKGRL